MSEWEAVVIEGKSAIAVLGPTQRATAEDARRAAEQLGLRLASAGYSVVVQGTDGCAEAAAKGAHEAGGDVFAVTTTDHDLPHVATVRVDGPIEAMKAVLERADALVVLPGGLAALAAVTQVWLWGQSPRAPYRQMVLVGPQWPGIVTALADAAGLDARTKAMVTMAADPAEAVETLRYYISPNAR